ncbi:hypothetical protein P170DRAFT_366130 [Aspergillus steynii IBT 23096]|uniref:Dockerin type 1 n=1 Tax=Aspergillus steynii IBT 23096 TaxID=1392250 RepID=A0A2I2FVZ8_9EURO|nr:uncharacterized protein P170DRAFT_366130 [Aspergillus steynii IBT 23096]PLB44795.1 hypothetical protein P170DRAFT_366130 [Aspergillus steynii IBT 23096]
MTSPIIHILGDDPHTTHRLNACAYQQSAITTFNGWQYVAFYTSSPTAARRVTLARRALQTQSWQYLTFNDYEQTTDDGHNTISIGICPGDATIHLSFDHHCDVLKYRISRLGLAADTDESSWVGDNFSPIQNHLPGQGPSPLKDVTYPRFLPAGRDLYFECRIGKAGAGSDILHRYTPATAQFTSLGTYLVGHRCNPYPNGISFHPETAALHVTWTNRHFIDYDGADDQDSTAHKAQAGPNGPENNEGLYHSYSTDGGATWLNSAGGLVASLSPETTTGLDSQDARLRVKIIPRDSGIMNQEAQYIDSHGGVHVLNRENTSGREMWVHYYRDPGVGGWSFYAVPGVFPTATGPRGKVVYCGRSNVVYLVLPGNTQDGLIIARMSGLQSLDREFEVVWRRRGYVGEPLVDEEAFLHFGILSVFTMLEKDPAERRIAVLQFDVDELAK